MFAQYLDAYADEDEPSDDLHLPLEEMAHAGPDDRSRIGKQECDNAYDDRRGEDVHLQEGEAYSDRQGVDARGYGQEQQRHKVIGIHPLPVAVHEERLVDHLAADKSEQRERYPVIDALDQVPDAQPCQVADDGHDGLEQPEGKRDAKGGAEPQLHHGDAARDGYGEGVHGESHGNEQDGRDIHGVPVARDQHFVKQAVGAKAAQAGGVCSRTDPLLKYR